MLVYEPKRTASIVSRLVAIANSFRTTTILIYVLGLGAVFALFAAALEPSVWWVGALVGGILGYIAGALSASLFVVLMEWLVQMLVAQEGILAALRKQLVEKTKEQP